MLVTAYSTTTGKAVQVPEHWLTHPTLGAHLSKTPPHTTVATDHKASKATTAPVAGDKKE